MKKTKIITHIASGTGEYRSFLKNLYHSNDVVDVSSTNFHGNLFEIYYQYKPDILIMCAGEYTQEFHDFISEHEKHLQIVLFIDVPINNTQLIDFWNNTSILGVGRKDYLTKPLTNDKLFYNKLYDNTIFSKTDTENRNDKIAVILSKDDEINEKIIGPYLYPATKEKFVLFNSPTYKKFQNTGTLNAPDTCLVFNTYKCLVDLDNSYEIEASVCSINNIETEGDLLENIKNGIVKNIDINIEESSYDYFIKNKFLSTIIKE
jgi:hypothetical protein